jgi:phage head maturation protease
MSEPLLQTRALFAPDTVNAEERTVEVTWTTGASVARNGMEGSYFEELSMTPQAIRMERLNSGAPLLNSHSAADLSDVVGVVERAWLDGEVGRALVRFSSRDEVTPIFNDVRDGIIRNISVGYRVWKYERDEQGETPVMRAVDWEPHELSLVPIPADSGAQVRSEDPFKLNHEPEKDSPMDEIREHEGTMVPEAIEPETRAASPEDIQAAISAERRRVAEIRRTVRAAGLEADVADQLEQDGIAVDEARKFVIDQMAAKQAAVPARTQVAAVVTHDEGDKRAACMEAALEARTGLREWDDQSRAYVSSSLLDMAKESVERSGQNLSGMSRSEIASRAMHSTSDFPLLLSNIARKTLSAAYEAETQTWRPLSRQRNMPDFKPAYELEIAGQIIPEPLLEGGEYKAATVKEQQSSWRIYTYGKKISVSRQLIINDDLDALSRIPAMIGRGMSLFESNQVWALITGNAQTSYDSTALFNAAHNNQGTGVIGEAAISAARKALRNQKDIAENRINLRPKFMIVPAALETSAQKFLTGVNPTETQNVNVFANSLGLIVEPRLDDASELIYYVTADPAQIDMVAHGYLQGEQGPQVETVADRDPDGTTIYARLDFGTTLLNHRGFYKSTGA